MDKYLILIKTYIKYNMRYPLGLFLKIVYLPIQMFLYIFLWMAISRYSEIDLKYMICYYLFAILLGYAFPFAHIARDIQNDMFEGIIFNYLVRPVAYVVPIIARYFAWMLCYVVVFIPSILFAAIFYRISFINIIYFVVFAFWGIIVEFLIWINAGFISMRIEQIRGVIMAVMVLKSFASGSLIPFSFLPDAVRKAIEYMPFKFYIYEPINVLLKGTDCFTAAKSVGFALIWIVLLIVIAFLQWHRNMKRLQANVSLGYGIVPFRFCSVGEGYRICWYKAR